MIVDASVYPDQDPPLVLETPEDKADYVHRICGAFDFGLPPTADTLVALRAWKEVFDRFPLPASPGYHALRSYYGWEPVARLPALSTPHYRVRDALEGREDGCEHLV